MQIYMAPLQGLTDWIYREAFCRYIGGIDKTFTPFVRVQQGQFYRPAQCRDLLPEHNQFQKPIPQFLGNDLQSFLKFEELCSEQGYTEVNINMGCPYPMVTGRGFGAGMLSNPDHTMQLLDNIFAHTNLQISVKSRIGMELETEFKPIAELLNQFPLKEVIIHPRVAKQQYKGSPNREAFTEYAKQLKHPVCYNGDLERVDDLQATHVLWPEGERWMLGRGLLTNPFLALELKGIKMSLKEKSEHLLNFHLYMLELCATKYQNEQQYLKRFEELWHYHASCFEDGHKLYKMVKKSKHRAQYESIVRSAQLKSED